VSAPLRLEDARARHAEDRRARARRLTDQLRGALDLSVELLTTAYRERFDRELGYPSWSAYCRTELPQLAILGKGLPPVERRAVVLELRRQLPNAGLRPLGEALGLAPNSIKAALAEPAAPAPVEEAPRPRLTNVARAVLHVRESGETGRTVHEVTRKLKVNQCAASALLSRLAADGRLAYRRPAKRGQVGRYVIGRG
jgi:hypothetical protein